MTNDNTTNQHVGGGRTGRPPWPAPDGGTPEVPVTGGTVWAAVPAVGSDEPVEPAPDQGDTASADEAKKNKIVGVPKLVIDESGASLELTLLHRNGVKVNLGFRVSFRGESLHLGVPTFRLTAGGSRVKVSLPVPLVGGLKKGSKVKVTVVGPGGVNVGVASTGVFSVALPNGSGIAVTKAGLVATSTLTIGLVTLVATGVLPPEPEPAVSVPVTSDEQSDDEPIVDTTVDEPTTDEPTADEPTTDEPSTDETVPPEPVGWPLVVPESITALHRPSTNEQGITTYPLGDPGPLDIEFAAVGAAVAGTRTHRVTIEVGGRTASLGEIVVPSHIDAVDTATFELARMTIEDVVLLGAGAPMATTCYDTSTLATRGGYRASGDPGTITAAFDAIPTEGESFAVGVSVVFQTEAGAEPLSEEGLAAMDGPDCGLRRLDSVRWTFPNVDDAADDDTPDDETPDDESPDDESPDDESPDDESSADESSTKPIDDEPLTYIAEPEAGALLLGHEGRRVAMLQRGLTTAGFLDGEIDGQFGPRTDEAVRRLQEASGLDVDGIAGPATHDALGLPYVGLDEDAPDEIESSEESARGPLRLGHVGPRVARLQVALIDAGFLESGGADGEFGPSTFDALQAFQEERGLDVDGVAREDEHSLLGIPYE